MKTDAPTELVRAERQSLADLLTSTGPDAPTLCGDWTTGDLAAHLVARERRPLSSLGLAVRPLAGLPERARLDVRRDNDWAALVAKVRAGAPVWSPMGNPFSDVAFNLIEFFIHHEDVRRAQPGWVPRVLPGDLEDALWTRLRAAGPLMARRAPSGLTVVAGDRVLVVHDGEPMVTVSGQPSELALFCSGRQRVARVDATGPADAVTALHDAPLGQ